MTPQEQQMLDDLTTRINQTQLQEKDPEAEQFLNQKLGRNPDALYIMAQTTLVQGYALEQAQKQLADAKAQIAQLQQQPKQSTSFLGNLFGSHDDPKPPQQPQYQQVPNTPPPPSYYAQQGNDPPPPPPQYAPQYGAPQYAQPQGGGAFQQGGFLRSAMTTATGVAAGALAFEGIESLMHGFGGRSGGGYGMGDFGGGGAPREEIINNYYGDDADRHNGGLGPDIEDRRGDTRQFADSGSGSDFSQRDDDSSGGAADYGADSDSNANFGSDDSSSNDNYDPGGNDDSF